MNGEKDSLLQEQQEKLNKTDQELETLLGKLGSELGLEKEESVMKNEATIITQEEDENYLLNNEENILKLLKSLDNAGKIMDLIDVRGEDELDWNSC